MSRKTNTLLLMLVATILNFIVIGAVIGIGWLIISAIIREKAMTNVDIIFPLLVSASIIIDLLIYRKIWNIFSNKVNIQENFDPLFGRKKKPEETET